MTTEAEPMDVVVGGSASPPSPLDASFLESLSDPVKSLVQEVLDHETTAARPDLLEIKLRSHLLELTNFILHHPQKDDTLRVVQLEDYWKSCLDTCLHLVHFSSSTEKYKGMGAAAVRKLPFVLLEDVVETLPLQLVQSIWNSTVMESSIAKKLYAEQLWIKTSHLVWIRVCNKLLKQIRGGAWAGRILLSLAAVFPLSERSAMNVLGSFHTDNVTNFESLDEFQAHNASAADTKVVEGGNEENAAMQMEKEKDKEATTAEHNKDYAFYETFWSIQQDFSNPNAIDLDIFTDKMQTILAVLESHSFDSSTATTSTTHMSSSSSKYLTNSQLLHLQLCDPELRIHFLTQYLIVESFLNQASLEKLSKRAKDLMRHTPPRGKAHLQTLEWILEERESMWRKWKRNKCTPDLEKKASNSANTATRKKLSGAMSTTDNEDAEDLFHYTIDVQKELPQISKDMVNVVPSLHAHLEPYVEALDPEAGIEPEYHPKNDSLYSWRAMRLLSRNHLGLFDKVRRRDGDFETLVRHVYKTEGKEEIPGDGPETEPFDEFEEQTEMMNGTQQAQESSDADNDAASVGSPMVEEENEQNDKDKEAPRETAAVKEEVKEEEKPKDTAATTKESTEEPKKDVKEDPNKKVSVAPTNKETGAAAAKKEESKDDNSNDKASTSRRGTSTATVSGNKRKEPAPPVKKEERSRQPQPHDDHGGGTSFREGNDRRISGRRGRSPPRRNSPPERGRRPPSPRGRDDRGGRRGGDRHDQGGRDDRRGRSQDDRGGKRRRHGGGVGGGRRSY